jgi:hypothetical protein
MGLAELQRSLARLYTDAAARAELRADPRRFARQCGLSADEGAALEREVLGDAEIFARSLRRKRMDEAARSMPLAGKVLGPDFACLFQKYASATPLGPMRNPALDALDFHRWLLAPGRVNLSPGDRDALRYEAAWLTMLHTNRSFLVLFLQRPGAEKASRSLVVWWRWRGKLRHW